MSWKQSLSYLRVVKGILHGSRAYGGPIQASLSITNRCNIQCVHCYFHSPYIERPNLIKLRRAKQTSQELPDDNEFIALQKLEANTDRTVSLIDELIELGTVHFHFSGSGEPFLHKSILEFLARVKHANCTCSVNTAGHLLDQETIDSLLKIGLDELRVTTMAGNAEVYLRTHPGIKKSTFESLQKNLLYLTEQKKAIGSRLRVNLYCVVISQNYNSLMDFAKFACDVNADRVMYQPVDDVRDPGLNRVIPTIEEASYVKKQLRKVKAYLKSKRIKHNIDNFLKIFNAKVDTSDLYRIIPCFYGWLSVRIDVDGNVYPCCRCYRSFGNTYKQTFSEIWFGDYYRQFRKESITLNRRKKPVIDCDCYSCPHYNANIRVYRAFHPIRGRKL